MPAGAEGPEIEGRARLTQNSAKDATKTLGWILFDGREIGGVVLTPVVKEILRAGTKREMRWDPHSTSAGTTGAGGTTTGRGGPTGSAGSDGACQTSGGSFCVCQGTAWRCF